MRRSARGSTVMSITRHAGHPSPSVCAASGAPPRGGPLERHARRPVVSRARHADLVELLLRDRVAAEIEDRLRRALLELHHPTAGWSVPPFRAVTRSFREHRPAILDGFAARTKGALALGATEGLNLKAKLRSQMAHGFRCEKHATIALPHRPGDLPEAPWLIDRA